MSRSILESSFILESRPNLNSGKYKNSLKFKKCRTERQTHPVTHYYIDINALKIVAQFLSKKYLNSHLAILIKNAIQGADEVLNPPISGCKQKLVHLIKIH